MRERDDMKRASEHLERAAEHASEAAHHTKEAMEAGAAGTLERAKDTARDTARETARRAEHVAEQAADTARDVGKKAGRAAQSLRHAQPDRELEQRVDSTTEHALDSTGQAVRGAAPTVRRGVESAVDAAGAALHAAAGPLGAVVGKIAGRVGGWWNTASEALAELPAEEEKACRVHFEAYEMRPDAVNWATARTAYTLGYVAAENPTYRNRPFDEVESELQHGFEGEQTEEYRTLRDFTRFGYERAKIIRPSQDEDRVEIR